MRCSMTSARRLAFFADPGRHLADRLDRVDSPQEVPGDLRRLAVARRMHERDRLEPARDPIREDARPPFEPALVHGHGRAEFLA